MYSTACEIPTRRGDPDLCHVQLRLVLLATRLLTYLYTCVGVIYMPLQEILSRRTRLFDRGNEAICILPKLIACKYNQLSSLFTPQWYVDVLKEHTCRTFPAGFGEIAISFQG